MKYESHLDGLRALSIMLVISNHVKPPLIYGGIGVDIFFAISGFLITNILLNEYDEFQSISLRKFYTKRVFRILPLYFITILIYAIAAFSVSGLSNNTNKLVDFYNAFPYIVSMNSEFRSDTSNTVFGHAWSLGIEEKFYILWPLLLLLMGENKRVVNASVVGLIGISAALLIKDSFMVRGYFGLIFASMATVGVRRYKDELIKMLAKVSGFFLVGAGAGASYAFFQHKAPVFGYLTVGVFSTFLIISLHLAPQQCIGKILSIKPLVLIGRLSYGVYLIHILVLNLISLVFQNLLGFSPWLLTYLATLMFSIGAAHVLRIMIERPMIEFGRSLLKRKGADIGTSSELAAPDG